LNLLPDTQLLLWAAESPAGPHIREAAVLMGDPANRIYFSAASIWEVAIKFAQGRADFRFEPRTLRRALIDNGYVELPITSEHGAAVASLPLVHKDPFDRMLVAQAMAEGLILLTADAIVARYPGPIRLV
jgi:PIN domain nuclease of toxin-antitoxin system